MLSFHKYFSLTRIYDLFFDGLLWPRPEPDKTFWVKIFEIVESNSIRNKEYFFQVFQTIFCYRRKNTEQILSFCHRVTRGWGFGYTNKNSRGLEFLYHWLFMHLWSKAVKFLNQIRLKFKSLKSSTLITLRSAEAGWISSNHAITRANFFHTLKCWGIK